MVAESWFRGLWKLSRKQDAGFEKAVIRVLAFEVASLMSKLIHLWRSLSDKQIARLREEINTSVGIKKLISDDEDFIGNLICMEMTESMENIAKSVARLARKCSDPGLKNFDSCFCEFMKMGADPYGWEFGFKKMDSKVKKMERFISVNASLYQQMEILADLEQTFKTGSSHSGAPENLHAFQKKVTWKQQEVESLRKVSLWNRTYDYVVLLLARSLFTVHSRIKKVFGIGYTPGRSGDLISADSDHKSHAHRHSVSVFSQPLVNQSETTCLPRFASGPLGRYTVTTTSGPLATRSTKMSDFLSGPLNTLTPKSGPIVAERHKFFKFYSGTLGKLTSKSGPIAGTGKTRKKMWQIPEKTPIHSGKDHHINPKRLTQVGPFKECMISEDGINSLNSRNPNEARCSSSAEHLLSEGNSIVSDTLISCSRPRLLDAPPDTLGAACLAIHYANVITLIERFVASPHLIGDDAREDLYNMLPTSLRASLRERLKPYMKNFGSATFYDPVLAKEWTDAMAGILEWLAPLAHQMIKWQSERSYEHQTLVSRTNLVLVQTLYFANRRKTESIITELLVGLNYVWRFNRQWKSCELSVKPET